MTQPSQSGFFDALRGVWRQSRRIEQPDEEVLQSFRRVTETVTVTEASTYEEKTAGAYRWTTASDTDRIIWGEWVQRTTT